MNEARLRCPFTWGRSSGGAKWSATSGLRLGRLLSARLQSDHTPDQQPAHEPRTFSATSGGLGRIGGPSSWSEFREQTAFGDGELVVVEHALRRHRLLLNARGSRARCSRRASRCVSATGRPSP
jgi:hypothetical protein